MIIRDGTHLFRLMVKSYMPKDGPLNRPQPIPYLWRGATPVERAGRRTNLTPVPKVKRKEFAPESEDPPPECHGPVAH